MKFHYKKVIKGEGKREKELWRKIEAKTDRRYTRRERDRER